jgi:hypothetical protein
MEEKELTQIVEAVKAEVDKKGFLNTEGVEKHIAEAVEKIKSEMPKDVEAAVKEQGLKIQQLMEVQEKNQRPQTREEIINEKHAEIIKELKTNKTASIFIPERKTLLQRSAAGSATLGLYLSDIGQEAYRGLVLANAFNSKSLPAGNNGYVRYMDQTTVTRNADYKAEGIAAPESALAWTEYTMRIEKIMDSIPVTWEAMNDLSFVQNEVGTLLERNILIKEETSLWSGDGNTPNIKGIYTYATAFNAGASSFASSITTPTIADLALAVAVTISNQKEGMFMPQTIVLNPVDAAKLKMEKDSTGQYVVNGGSPIAGMNVIVCSSVTANTMLVGDFRYADYYTDGGIRVEFGYVNTQFTEDEMTIKAVKRGGLLVRKVHEGAFYKVTSISAALTSLTS